MKLGFEKINDKFFTDLSHVQSVGIEEVKTFDEDEKKVIIIFQVIGFTDYGQRLPFPLAEFEKYSDADDWVVNTFVKP